MLALILLIRYLHKIMLPSLIDEVKIYFPDNPYDRDQCKAISPKTQVWQNANNNCSKKLLR